MNNMAGFVGVRRPTLTKIERIVETAEQKPELYRD